MPPTDRTPFQVLILCTGNSARSQIAEALLQRKSAGRFVVESAGSTPAARVNSFAVEVLREAGINWEGRTPRGLDAVADRHWDFVITVCDRAREACPILPGQPIMAHWGMADPAAVEGDQAEQRRAFHSALVLLNRRIDLFLALPLEKLERLAAERGVRQIGEAQ